MRVRIVSDGTRHGTKVVDERGVRLDMVTKVEWEMETRAPFATARVTFSRVPVELIGELAEVKEVPSDA